MKIDAVTLPNGHVLVVMQQFENPQRAREMHEGVFGDQFAKDLENEDGVGVTVLVSADEPVEFGSTLAEVHV